MADTTIQKFTLYQLTGANAYAAMLTSQAAAATSATNAAASATAAATSAASAASAATAAVNAAVSGTVNKIAKFTGANTVGNSLLSDDGATLSYTGTIFQINSNGPNSIFRKANAPTDQKFWRTYTSDYQIVHDIVNDAYSAAQNCYIVSRSGNSITAHQWFIGGVERMRIDATGAIRLYSSTSKYMVISPSDSGNYVYLAGVSGINQLICDFDTYTFRNIAGSTILSIGATGVVDMNQSTARLRIAGTQVVGPRDTGWAAMTGTSNKNTTYDTLTVTLAQLAGRVMSMQTALTNHGLLGA